MRWTIRHPADRSSIATYGVDERGGLYVELTYCGAVVRHDCYQVDFDGDQPALSVLRVLAEFGFIDGGDIADAIEWLCEMSHHETLSPTGPHRRRRPRRRGRRAVLTVIENLQLAGG